MYGSAGILMSLAPMSTRAVSPSVALKPSKYLEHLFTAVVGLDASAVERERTVQSVSPPEGDPSATQVVGLLRRWFSLDVVSDVVIAGQRVRGVLLVPRVGLLCQCVDADAHDFLVDRADTKETMGQVTFRGGQVADRFRRAQYVAPHAETKRLVEAEVRKQDALVWRRGNAEDGGRVVQREEDHGVVIAMLALQIVDEAWRGRAKLANPFLLVVAAMRLGRQP